MVARRVRALAVGIALCGSIACQASPPVEIPRLHLFIDDHVIESSKGLERKIESPVDRQGPLITAADGVYTPYLTVLRGENRYRMWFNSGRGDRRYLGYLESPDGRTWPRPAKMLELPVPIRYGATVIDDDGRYLLAYWGQNRPQDGIHIATSPDGLQFKMVTPSPVISIEELGWNAGAGDIVTLFRDGGRYLLFVKMQTGVRHVTSRGYRIVGVSVSHNGKDWPPPSIIFRPDDRDQGDLEFYGLGGIVRRGDLLVGMLRVLRDDLTVDDGEELTGLGYTVLAWSRDGLRWERDRTPFLDRSPTAGAWDHAMAWADSQVTDGDRTLIYYGGYKRGHKIDASTGRQIGLAVIPRDRYVARAGTGSLTTKSLALEGGYMVVNASGRVAASVLDSAGTVVQTCELPGDDGVERRGSCALPTGQFRIRFDLEDARLYGFELRR